MTRFLTLTLAAVFVIALILAFLFSLGAASADSISRSIAEIEQARAMTAQANATQSAVSALGAVTVIDKLLQLALVILAILIVVAIVYILRQRQQMIHLQEALNTAKLDRPKTHWAPGPNAGWKKLDISRPEPPNIQEIAYAALLANLSQNLSLPIKSQTDREWNHTRTAIPRSTTPEPADTDIQDGSWEDFIQ